MSLDTRIVGPFLVFVDGVVVVEVFVGEAAPGEP